MQYSNAFLGGPGLTGGVADARPRFFESSLRFALGALSKCGVTLTRALRARSPEVLYLLSCFAACLMFGKTPKGPRAQRAEASD